MKKGLYRYNTDGTLFNFRGLLIKRLSDRNIEVFALSLESIYFPDLKKIGAKPQNVPFNNG